MDVYIIALKSIGLNNTILRLMLELLTLKDFKSIFEGNFMEIQLKYNLDLNKYSNLLSDLDLLKKSLNNASLILKESKENKIKHILITDKRYPQNLKNIPDAPVILYYKGRGFFKKHEKSISCVGTRKPTGFTSNAASSIIPSLVNEGFTIVSGLAEGSDTLSHQICLESNGTTIAVLAHGLDTIYPSENQSLANEILNHNGLLVSEYPIGTKADKFRFVHRNRIITGLSKSTIVFEAREKSGTRHSVDYAIQQNKKIFVPQPVTPTDKTIFLHKLIFNGIAEPIPHRNAYDVIVYGSGYKIHKDPYTINKRKSKILSTYINNTTTDYDSLIDYFSKPKGNQKTISFSIDEQIHMQLTNILKEKNISKKDLLSAFITSLLVNENINT